MHVITLHKVLKVFGKFLPKESCSLISYSCREIATKLTIFVKHTIAQDEIRSATSAWWSILALISILNELSNEEQKFGDIERLLARVSLRFAHSIHFSHRCKAFAYLSMQHN